MRLTRSSNFVTLCLLFLSNLILSKTIRDNNGNNLSDCTCKCCSDRVERKDVACNVDVILLISAAACVKDYINNMKITGKKIIDDIEKRQSTVGDNGLYQIGQQARIGIITYSTSSHVVHNLNTPATSSELKHQLDQYDYQNQGEGDFIGNGLEAAYNMFNEGQKSGSGRRALIIMANGGTKDKDSDKLHTYTSKLRQISVDIMVNTITEQCDTRKDCLMCCPDLPFLTSNLATTDRVCDNRLVPDEENVGQKKRPYANGLWYNQCLDHLSYSCKGPKQVVGEECNKECTCECKQMSQGLSGRQGIAGRLGPDGPAGRNGAAGQPGKSGLPGMPGQSGSAGSDGQVAIDGLDGPNGRQGLVGNMGTNGQRGSDGNAGEPGLTGPPGVVGKKGAPGARGNPGAPGLRGPPGLAGDNGKRGLRGDDGLQGQTGDHGVDGEKGANGDNGEDGEDGPQGYPGNDGINGEPGLCGDMGEDGVAGSKGIPGVDGHDGRQGAPGPKGARGDQGLPGIQGKIDYKQYSSVIVEEIRHYLNNYGWKFVGNNGQAPKPRPTSPPVVATTTTTEEPRVVTKPSDVVDAQTTPESLPAGQPGCDVDYVDEEDDKFDPDNIDVEDRREIEEDLYEAYEPISNDDHAEVHFKK